LAALDTPSAPAHRLGGKIVEALGDKEAALRYFTTSYHLDTTQQDLIFTICGLVLNLPATVENYELQLGWLKKGEAIDKQNNSVISLKQHLMLYMELKKLLLPVLDHPNLKLLEDACKELRKSCYIPSKEKGKLAKQFLDPSVKNETVASVIFLTWIRRHLEDWMDPDGAQARALHHIRQPDAFKPEDAVDKVAVFDGFKQRESQKVIA